MHEIQKEVAFIIKVEMCQLPFFHRVLRRSGINRSLQRNFN